jgi:hypothetical protein
MKCPKAKMDFPVCHICFSVQQKYFRSGDFSVFKKFNCSEYLCIIIDLILCIRSMCIIYDYLILGLLLSQKD